MCVNIEMTFREFLLRRFYLILNFQLLRSPVTIAEKNKKCTNLSFKLSLYIASHFFRNFLIHAVAIFAALKGQVIMVSKQLGYLFTVLLNG